MIQQLPEEFSNNQKNFLHLDQQQSRRLHPDTLEEVKQRANIVDVISENVVLHKRGKDWVGLCLFHQKKTPSFSASPTKQMYYCIGFCADLAERTQP
jgi:hypothetical protein